MWLFENKIILTLISESLTVSKVASSTMDLVFRYNIGNKEPHAESFLYLSLFKKAIHGSISKKLNVKATELNIWLEGYSQMGYWRLEGCEGLMGGVECGGTIGQS